jgi:hypothetical protein
LNELRQRDAADVAIERARIERVHEVAIVVDHAAGVSTDDDRETTEARFSDLTLTATQPSVVGAGRGLAVQGGALVSAERALIDANHELGAYVWGDGSRLELTELLVAGTAPIPCEECGLGGGGIGIGSYEAGHVIARRFAIHDNAAIGVQLSRGGIAELDFGAIAGHPVGVNAQSAGSDATRTLQDVRFSGNTRNLDTDALPTPRLGL